MVWEKFTETGKSFKPKISIRGAVQIGFNTAAVKEFKLKDYGFAVLFYDSENKRIGIKLTNAKDEEGVCLLRVRDDDKGAHVSAKSYITKYTLDKIKNKRLDAIWDSSEEMIVANIEESLE